MKWNVRRLAPVALVLAALATPVDAQSGFPWWKDEKVVRDLGLTSEQSARIDSEFRATYPQLSQSKEDLDRQEAELSRLIAINADEVQVTRQIDRVETVRAALNKTRTIMLLHMVRVLSPEQRARFTPIHEQWQRDHPRPSRPSDSKGRTDTRP